MEKIVDFTNFHNKTKAYFVFVEEPEREPDYVSPSGSKYWNTGEGVIRQSDHWSGTGGCFNIKSCWWELPGYDSGVACGYCAFSAFILRKSIPVWHIIKGSDLALATRLQHSAIAASDWTVGSGRYVKKKHIPRWAEEVNVKDCDDWRVAALLKERPKVRKAIIAKANVVRSILRGSKKIKIGSKLV